MPWEEENQLITGCIRTLFIEQPLGLQTTYLSVCFNPWHCKEIIKMMIQIYIVFAPSDFLYRTVCQCIPLLEKYFKLLILNNATILLCFHWCIANGIQTIGWLASIINFSFASKIKQIKWKYFFYKILNNKTNFNHWENEKNYFSHIFMWHRNDFLQYLI